MSLKKPETQAKHRTRWGSPKASSMRFVVKPQLLQDSEMEFAAKIGIAKDRVMVSGDDTQERTQKGTRAGAKGLRCKERLVRALDLKASCQKDCDAKIAQ